MAGVRSPNGRCEYLPNAGCEFPKEGCELSLNGRQGVPPVTYWQVVSLLRRVCNLNNGRFVSLLMAGCEFPKGRV